MSAAKNIVIKGARTHNLKNIDVVLPRDKLVVITGISGSGKSSLAFDTVYAEGQRRYVESLSAYARQFLPRNAKPDVDSIDGLSPAVAIEQRNASKNPRSTVGTVTEIYDYIRLLYARLGKPYCPECKLPISSQSVQQIVDAVLKFENGTRFSVVAPVIRRQMGQFKTELNALRREGFTRVAIDGELCDLGDEVKLDRRRRHDIDVYVDRLVMKEGLRRRLTDSVEIALRLAGGQVKISPLEGDKDFHFSQSFACVECGFSIPDLSPRMFSFNNPQGACTRCDGLGRLFQFDDERVVHEPDLSLREGAIEPWARRSAAYFQQILEVVAKQYGFDLYTPYRLLTKEAKEVLLHGSGEEKLVFPTGRGSDKVTRPFEGVIPNLERRLREMERRRRDGGHSEDGVDDAFEEFHRYMREVICPDCKGTRLRKESRHVLLNDMPIHKVTRLNIGDCLAFFRGLKLEKQEQEIGERVLREVTDRLSFLDEVGVGYLTVDRSVATLSGGESQRIRLATQIGSALTGVLYILDEPSIGLHQRDNQRLLKTLARLRDLGNTVLIVEHDEDTIRAADYVVDMGPGAGQVGGRVVAAGAPEELEGNANSLTGAYLSGRRRIEVPKRRRKPSHGFLVVKGATNNNLRKLTVRFPIGVFTCVTGVSGSGKSSLVVDTLLRALQERLYRSSKIVGPYEELTGVHLIDKVVAIDQSPIGRTPRSNPATYTGVFTHIRDLFAQLPEAKMRGYKAGRFSFNVKGGRCESCEGDGVLRIEMNFLPDVYVTCEVCEGRRLNRETLEVRFKGKNIADVLDMTVRQAHVFLGHVPKIRQKLETLIEVGLDYLRLGQPANTLSGGEAQRIKISRELSKKSNGMTLYILDEPTTGLHFEDINRLLDVLNRLTDSGNTVVVIEHNLDVIKCADYIIDLGPEGGDKGGELVAAGSPRDVAKVARSYTGQYLKEALKVK
ncbi:MAG: excinuclease ABC subunit UvrA [bacterium]